MPVRQEKSSTEGRCVRGRIRDKMETIWLQRSSLDQAWGFRLMGGREFGVPLTIQRVTPGTVAAATLGPGDVIIKIGNVMATNLDHSDAHDLVRQSGNLLQLTIQKSEGQFQPSQLPTLASQFANPVTVQVNDDYNSFPTGFGTGLPLNANTNKSPAMTNYATTPRNFGSQIQANRANSAQTRGAYSADEGDQSAENGGLNLPDYTLAYKNNDPVHDSPSGQANIRGYSFPEESPSYSTKSLPRNAGGYISNGRDGFTDAGGSHVYETKSQIVNQSSFNPANSSEIKFNTGLPFQANPHKAQQSFTNYAPQPSNGAPQPSNAASQPSYNSTQPMYNSVARPFSPSTYQGPVSPRSQTNSTLTKSEVTKEATTISGPVYSQTPSNESGSNGVDKPNLHIPGSNPPASLPHSKPSYITNNNNNSFNVYNSSPQPFSIPKPYAPAQTGYSPASTPSQPRPFQSQMSPGSSSSNNSAPVIRRVSFDQTGSENGPHATVTNFTARPYRPPQVATVVNYSGTAFNAPGSHQDDSRAADIGISQPAGFPPRKSSKPDDGGVYTAMPYNPQAGPSDPPSRSYETNKGGYNQQGVREAVENLNLGSPKYEPQAVAPPPPPPSVPPPPPAPPINGWNSAPSRHQKNMPSETSDEQKIPDQLLSTMLQSAKGGGPKPFTYGIDLLELKKKIGPPTAPKSRPVQPSYQGQAEEQEATKQYGGPPKKPAGQVQSDYYIKRDNSEDPATKPPKKPVGQIQSDFYHSRQTGPRSEIDESPININMGTNPKKQSKSFKVLQWMTETENEEPEATQKPRRNKDPERRHNADDDEMTFTGLHSKAEIPSKAFGILQRLSSDDGSAPTQNGKATLDAGDADDPEDGTFRYKGKGIPSPSFRVLQTWAESDPDPSINSVGYRKDEDEEDNLPENLNPEDLVDKRYKGATIPSKVFKALQKSLGDDASEISLQANLDTQGGGQIDASISEF